MRFLDLIKLFYTPADSDQLPVFFLISGDKRGHEHTWYASP